MHALWLMVVSVSSHGPQLTDSVGLLVGFCFSWVPVYFPQLLRKTPEFSLLFGWDLCVCYDQLLGGASQRTLMLIFCKHISVPLIVSRAGSLRWDGYQVGSGVGWLFPHFCSIFIPTHFVGRVNCGLKIFVIGLVSHSLHCESGLGLDSVHFSLHIPHC